MRLTFREVLSIAVTAFTVGWFVPFDEYYKVVFFIITAIILLLTNVPWLQNQTIYKKSAIAIFCFVLAHTVSSAMIKYVSESDIENVGMLIALLAVPLLAMYFVPFILGRWSEQCEMIEASKKPGVEWQNVNLFVERNDDLDRLEGYLLVNRVDILGIEGAWGSGKSFLLEGFREKIDKDEKCDYLTIDVLAIRLEKFPQYMIGQLDRLLQKNNVLSKNSNRLRDFFNKPELSFLSSLWIDKTSSYAILFDAFQNEILDLRKDIYIIFEDIDRVSNVDGIKNIFYLAEKLTSKNVERVGSGIHIIYQYSMEHMQKLSITEEFIEKYIPFRMSLTDIGFVEMVQAFQKDIDVNSIWYIRNEELYRLPPHFHIPRQSPVNEERAWVASFFRDRFTIRKVKYFLKEFEIKSQSYPSNLSQDERHIVLAMCFMEFFMPKTYKRLQCDYLYGRFVIYDENGQPHSMHDVCSVRDTYANYLNPYTNGDNFELYVAWRLLGLDAESARVNINAE